MRVIFVADCIDEINNKINKIKTRFGDDIVFVVKSPLVKLFETYGYQVAATYYHNLSLTIHKILANLDRDNTVIYYSSLKPDDELLNQFISKIGFGEKVVCVVPSYNTCERMFNNVYNVYVKNMFKLRDSMASPKLQYLPSSAVDELLQTHIANKLFELNPKAVNILMVKEKTISDSLKIKVDKKKNILISCIVALLITIFMLATIANFGVNFVLILGSVVLYILDVAVSFIIQFKEFFDARFLR